jgi:adenine-specific DNA-methyltransferase
MTITTYKTPMLTNDFDVAYEAVCKLVDIFEAGKTTYLSSSYQESHARTDHIDKFFIALGWDVGHSVQTNPYAQEVKIERSVTTGAARRRADYAFSCAPRFNRPLFFVEAKKPSSPIATADNYFQAIRYSWNTQLPLVVLTDFANFHIIDSRFPPNLQNALNRQHKVFTYKDYKNRDKFAEIYWLFSKEAVLANSISLYVASLPDKEAPLDSYQMGLFAGGYTNLDELFLYQLDEYRETLARAYKRDNQDLDGEQLTEVVQRTLDRLVFLRFLEDKLIEPESVVQKISVAKNPWAEFITQSKRLNAIYNGIVFKPHALLDTPNFVRITQDFVQICRDLSAYDSPYDFNYIPVEILGRIYERFLGKVVTATAKRVKVEDKPAVRKAGGVFYTPDYIVQYMSEQALAPLVADKSPAELLKIRVIDTSCGSGSFLIGTFDVLQRALSQLYFHNPSLAKAGEWIDRDGQLQLSLRKKRELLVQCIHGVDIDPQAVEVAQLSLYLKLMEDETGESARSGQLEIQEALLPTLNRNIVVGNSLTAPLDDAYANDIFMHETGDDYGAVNIRATFPQVMQKEGGFDLIIGNPPYIKEYTHKEAFDGLHLSPYYQGKMDLWYLFACRGFDLLKPNKGRLAFIATNNWTTNSGAKKLRQKILTDGRIEKLIDFGDYKVFKDAGVQTMILLAVCDKKPAKYSFDLRRLDKKKPTLANAQALLLDSSVSAVGEVRLTAQIDRALLEGKTLTFSGSSGTSLLYKIAKSGNFSLNKITEIAQGIVMPQNFLNERLHPKLAEKLYPNHGIFNLSNDEKRDLALSKAEAKLIKPFYTTLELQRYYGLPTNQLWVIYTDSSFKSKNSMDDLPKLKKHLDQFKSVITSDNKPYGLHRSRDEKFFIGEKIISARMCSQPTFTYTDFDCYVSQTFNVIKTERINQKYLTALFNSKVMHFWLRHKGKTKGKMFQVDKEPLLDMPLHQPNAAIQTKVATLVDSILRGLAKRTDAATEVQKETIDRHTEAADQQIQTIIYGLYGLDDAEIEHLEANL